MIPTKSIIVSHDNSKQTRDRRNQMAVDAKSKDGTNNVNYNYSVKETESELQKVRREKGAIQARNTEQQP